MSTLAKFLIGTSALAMIGVVVSIATTDTDVISSSEPQEDVLAYSSVQDCVDGGLYDTKTCQEEYDKAKKMHKQVAPRYGSANQCYDDFGQNRCYHSGSSIWLPFMVGYMMAPRAGNTFVSTQPLYRSANAPNSFSTAQGGRVGAVGADGKSKVAKSQVGKPAARTRTVSRGGFGVRAAGRSSGA